MEHLVAGKQTQVKKRIKVKITGTVQGVGFRPTVYKHAQNNHLSGSVQNTLGGVVIEAQGEEENLNIFLDKVIHKLPKEAKIEHVDISTIPTNNDDAFRIIASKQSGKVTFSIPADIATCQQCLNEFHDPENRRLEYPFINCTDCGPRFTIIDKIPYDRKNTSMKSFQLCQICQNEYTNPGNRRFEAQPNACPQCGPQISLISAENKVLPGDPLKATVRFLKQGKIIAVKGLGGYHLCCDARSEDAIRRIRERKKRPSKALAIMFRSLDEIKKYCQVSKGEEKELLSSMRPIVILLRKTDLLLPKLISPDTNDLGVFLPYTPIHHLILKAISPVVMTSCNHIDAPLVIGESELKPIMQHIADYAIIHNRPIVRRCDDSIVKIIFNKRFFIRRSRGFVPKSIDLPWSGPVILACGGDLKNTFCLTYGNKAYMSQHIGSLHEYATYIFFQEAIDDFLRLLNIKPEVIVHDLHPQYLSTRYALEFPGGKKIGMQHHVAHIAACMAEHGLNQPVIGVSLDGTGYGPDQTVWGGEFLITDMIEYRRVAHFKQYPMPGGQKAIQYPSRMALSYCYHDAHHDLDSDPFLGSLLKSQLGESYKQLINLLRKEFALPLTSSCGRLFDAVAALLGLCPYVTYEGQAAICLQNLVSPGVTESYPYEISRKQESLKLLSFTPMIRAIITDLKKRSSLGYIAAKFHNTVASAVVDMCTRIAQEEKIKTIALSGGVFQNSVLLERVVKGLRKYDLEVYYHHTVPCNDGGLALGQAANVLALNNKNKL